MFVSSPDGSSELETVQSDDLTLENEDHNDECRLDPVAMQFCSIILSM